MKIAIIGSGISGLTAAYYLHSEHDVRVFEANDYIGGHTATVDVSVESGQYAIDTGFIVFNDRTYPNFRRLLTDIGIGEQKTEMSFSVTNLENGLEYNGNNLLSLFAQKRNLLNYKFYSFLLEIVRFNKEARCLYQMTLQRKVSSDENLGEFLSRQGFSDYFNQNYILPMGAAIWSSSLSDMREFPLTFFLQFFYNHGLLNITQRPQWFVIPGGSKEYIKKLVLPFKKQIYLNSPVSQVKRINGKVEVVVNGVSELFDDVIFACHSDQALKLIANPTKYEKKILGKMQYQENEVVLHTDRGLLPRKKQAWASWNYHLGVLEARESRPASLTYNMNILQGIQAPEIFCVTLNATDKINPDKILKRFNYAHPVFNDDMISSQQARHLISGVDHFWFCGAYWYNGFHEDGVVSALDVVREISKNAPASSPTHLQEKVF